MAFCSNCGTQYQDGTRFCPKCGAPATAQPMAPPMYAPPPQQAPYYAPPPQPMYNNMMQAQPRYGGGKSKSVAMLLGFFFGPFTWLYTFKRDKGKFFLALLIGAIYWGVIIFAQSPSLLYLGYAAPLIWLWAFIGAVLRGSDWYAQY